MNIVYASACVSASAYAALYGASKVKPAFQAQKYNRLFIEGLAHHTRVDVIGYPDAESTIRPERIVKLKPETVGNAHYHYLWGFRGPYRRLHLLFGTFFKSLRLLNGDSAVVVDCLNQMAGLGAMLAARLRGKPCIGIVTDLPQFMGSGASFAVSRYLIRHCTGYVLLTEAMNAVVNPTGKPHVVLEGHADAAMEQCRPSLERKACKRICLYAGSINRIYGIGMLVEGFLLANLPDVELHIYGSGDYEQELAEIAEKHPNITYGGLLLPSQVVEKEMEATLLVNPRPSDEEFVRYSFPSKTMEYMSTGTPVLMTKLPCLPKEYLPHLYLIEQETPEGVARALRDTLAKDDETLFQKGTGARNFVLKERSNVIQAKKVLDMLERSQEK